GAREIVTAIQGLAPLAKICRPCRGSRTASVPQSALLCTARTMALQQSPTICVASGITDQARQCAGFQNRLAIVSAGTRVVPAGSRELAENLPAGLQTPVPKTTQALRRALEVERQFRENDPAIYFVQARVVRRVVQN